MDTFFYYLTIFGNLLWFTNCAFLVWAVLMIPDTLFAITNRVAKKWFTLSLSSLYAISEAVVFWYLFEPMSAVLEWIHDKPISAWEYIIYSMIAIAITILTEYFYVHRKSIPICPNCNTWYDATLLDAERSSYLAEEKVRRSVYNNSGKKVGYFNDTQLSIRKTFTGCFKCNHCGTEYVKSFRYK